MANQSTSTSLRPPAALGLAVAVAASALFSSWLDPELFPFLFGRDTYLPLVLLFVMPPFFAAALWLSRRHRFPVVWWLAWTFTLLMTSFSLVVASGLRAMSDDIQAHGLIP
jgi:hypothetical protein